MPCYSRKILGKGRWTISNVWLNLGILFTVWKAPTCGYKSVCSQWNNDWCTSFASFICPAFCCFLWGRGSGKVEFWIPFESSNKCLCCSPVENTCNCWEAISSSILCFLLHVPSWECSKNVNYPWFRFLNCGIWNHILN